MGCNSSKQPRLKKNFTADQDIFNVQKRIQLLPQDQLKNYLSQEHCAASAENINFYYKMGKILGSGSFGSVKLATLREQENFSGQKQFAIKSVSKERVADKLDLLIRELKIMKMLDHPNIIKFIEIYQDEQYIHYVMEYCSGSDLLQYVINEQFLNEDQAARLMFKLFSAVGHLHQKKIVHRDLKPENILFENKKLEECEIKIIDFGLSKILDFAVTEKDKKLSFVGTPLYVAPEVVKNVEYGTAVDMWSLGVIMYIMLSGRQPFKGEDMNSVYNKIIKGEFKYAEEDWGEVSQEAKDLVNLLLQVDPKKRIDAKTAIKHPWIQKQYLEGLNKKPRRKLSHSKTIIRNIKQYDAESKLKKEAMKIVINHQLTQTQMQKMLSLFKHYDVDQNGEIGFEDLLDCMKQQGIEIDENEVLQILQKFNQGEKNFRNPEKLTLNYYQFVEAALCHQQFLNKERLWAIFKHFDPDGNGFIDIESIKQVAAREGRTIAEQEIQSLQKEVGEKLNFCQFCSLLNPSIAIDHEKIIQPEIDMLRSEHLKQSSKFDPIKKAN